MSSVIDSLRLGLLRIAAALPSETSSGLRARQRRQSGQGMVEYALILVLIAIVVIVIVTVDGQQVNNVFSNISNGLAQ